jgi:hypothetical protein
MSLLQGYFRGPGISFSPCNTMKKRGPGLKRLRKGNLGVLSKNPLENFRISGWLLKRQGGVQFPMEDEEVIGTLPCFSQGGCLCGAVAVEGSMSCVCVPGSGAVGTLVFGVSTGVATACRALFAVMLVSGVPACT